MKRALTWVGVVLAGLAVVIGGLWFTIFGPNSPIADGPIADGVVSVKDSYASAYIVDAGPGKVALIDAGKDKSAEAILAALRKKGLTADAVVAIFLTHGHPDHTAGAAMFPKADVYAMASELPMLEGSLTIGHPLKDGEIVVVGDTTVEAFATPGHTPGSAVYLARGVLFFGDSAGASKKGEMMKAVSLTSKNPVENVASLKGLEKRLETRKADVKALAFGHTGPLQGFDPLAAFARTN
jgi:glyoxylase-like metal-dependent hydrolase (beta-lactamase superfamily II)